MRAQSITTLLTCAVVLATSCSSRPSPSAASRTGDEPAPLSPPYPHADVPDDAPLVTIRNVPATTGRANRPGSAAPFSTSVIGKFHDPFAIALLPDGAALITEKAGDLKLRLPGGTVVKVSGVPVVKEVDQGGLLDVAIAPDYSASSHVYLTFSRPAIRGTELALAMARLSVDQVQCIRAPCPPVAALDDVRLLWRSGAAGPGGQFGAVVAFAPDGKSLFLSSGERQRFTPAQDPDQALGKILRLTLDGAAWPGNPEYKAGGVRAMTWSSGHRNPYGLVFAPDGRLWEAEMGPRGGDELNLVLPGRNYGWPIVSNGDNYSGQPIPDHPSRSDLEAPKLWWNPVISPGGMIDYSGQMFPQWQGSLLIAGLSSEALIRVGIAGERAAPAEQWAMGRRIRDIAQAPDGAVWLLGDDGVLLRLTPKR